MNLKNYNLFLYQINQIKRKLEILDPSNVFENKEISRLAFEIESLRDEIIKETSKRPKFSLLKNLELA